MSDLLSSQQPFIFFIVFIWLLVLSYFFWQIYTHYRRLIGKSKREDLKDLLDRQLVEISKTKEALAEVLKRLRVVEGELPNNLKKVGLVRFSPYQEVGGNQSFSLALLDEESNGIVISSLHRRDTTRMYAKPVVSGKETKFKLSNEEVEAVKVAKTIKSRK